MLLMLFCHSLNATCNESSRVYKARVAYSYELSAPIHRATDAPEYKVGRYDWISICNLYGTRRCIVTIINWKAELETIFEFGHLVIRLWRRHYGKRRWYCTVKYWRRKLCMTVYSRAIDARCAKCMRCTKRTLKSQRRVHNQDYYPYTKKTDNTNLDYGHN